MTTSSSYFIQYIVLILFLMQNAVCFLLNWLSRTNLYLWFFNSFFNFLADPCYHYQSLSDASRKSSYTTPQSQEVCDKLLEGWYRFVGAAGTKMPTTHVPEFRCGTAHSGWLMTAHPTVEDGEAPGEVCFTKKRGPGCKKTKTISIQNCGSYFIYKLGDPPGCSMRYCGTDWAKQKKKR